MRLLATPAVVVVGGAWLVAALGGALDAAQQPQTTAKAQAPRDITGYWVSVVTEDWQWRMVTPRKGDYTSLPLNDAGRQLADTWDGTKDTGDNACKAFGAPAIMRVPGRIRVTWEDDTTLEVETDAGMQTRRLVFGRQAWAGWRVNNRGEVVWVEEGRDLPPPSSQRSWQGYSSARWDLAPDPSAVRTAVFFPGGLGTGPDGVGVVVPGRFGSLHATTTLLKPGYLRRNGVPYSATARLTEDFDFRTEDDGSEWFTVTSVVEDPTYLASPFVTSTDFKKEPDGSKWRPRSCSDY